MNAIEALNQSVFLRINGEVGTPAWVVNAAIGIGDYLIYLIPVLLVLLWLWGNEIGRNHALKACLVALLGVGINQIIPQFWQHPRPFMVGLGHAWIPHTPDSSFPSDHLTVFAGVGLSLLFDGAVWIGLTALIAGLFIAWARVFLGVHFPLDMIGAVVVATCSYLIASPIWHRAGTAVTTSSVRIYHSLFAHPIAAGWIRR